MSVQICGLVWSCLLINLMANLSQCKQEAIEVFDPTSGRHIRYETFDPNRPAPYSRAACEKLETWISIGDRGEIAECPVDPVSVAQDEQESDSDSEWSDTVEHRFTGVADILITGEVGVTIRYSSLVSFFCDQSLIIRFYADNRAT